VDGDVVEFVDRHWPIIQFSEISAQAKERGVYAASASGTRGFCEFIEPRELADDEAA